MESIKFAIKQIYSAMMKKNMIMNYVMKFVKFRTQNKMKMQVKSNCCT